MDVNMEHGLVKPLTINRRFELRSHRVHSKPKNEPGMLVPPAEDSLAAATLGEPRAVQQRSSRGLKWDLLMGYIQDHYLL